MNLSKRTRLLAAAAGAAILAGLLIWISLPPSGEGLPQSTESTDEPPVAEAMAPPAAPPGNPAMPARDAPLTSLPRSALVPQGPAEAALDRLGPPGADARPLALPDAALYARQARANPHHTPLAVRQFAATLAPRMERAMVSPAEAQALFERLADCVSAPGAVTSVRGICAVNAARLAERYPGGLAEPFRRLRAGMPDELTHSLEAAGYGKVEMR